jgi:hypothetical protein
MLAYLLSAALSVTAPPDAAGAKTRLSESDLAAKKEGAYVTGLPLLNSDPDRGVGFGARVYVFANGRRDDPLFAYTPYRHRVFAQYFRTTRGYEYHTLDWDAPFLAGSPYRVRAAFQYEREILANYYGAGAKSLGRLWRPGLAHTYRDAAAYDAANRAEPAYARHDNYAFDKPALLLALERDGVLGHFRPFVGVSLLRASIDDYTGHAIRVAGAKAVSAETRLAADARAGRLAGFDGGWVNKAGAGVAYDTRDFEPDPNRGAFHEVSAFAARKELGSDFNFNRLLAVARYFYSPLTTVTDLVLAGRAAYQVQAGDVPFFEWSALPFSDNNTAGLGGLRTLRGYRATRFVGPVLGLASLEARWTFAHFRLGGQDFAPMLVPFVDTGRPFDRVRDVSLNDWAVSEGLALRIAWNQATIIMLDYGVSPEGTGLYINFGHAF